MTIAMQPIYTQTVGSGGAASVVFNNIPQTFTDLMLQISARSDRASQSAEDVQMYFTTGAPSGTLFSYTALQGFTTGTNSFRVANNNLSYIGGIPASTATANTFGNQMTYIPNYTGSNFKSWVSDSVRENNSSTDASQQLWAGLLRSTSAISTIVLSNASGSNFVQHSTFTLYGITKG